MIELQSIWYIADSASNNKRAHFEVIRAYSEGKPLSGRELDGYKLRSNESVWLVPTTDENA